MSSLLSKAVKPEINNEILRRALAALSVNDKKTYVLVTESLFKDATAKSLCEKYRCSKSTVYKRLKEGKEFLLKHIDVDPWAHAREKEDSVNRKFPKDK